MAKEEYEMLDLVIRSDRAIIPVRVAACDVAVQRERIVAVVARALLEPMMPGASSCCPFPPLKWNQGHTTPIRRGDGPHPHIWNEGTRSPNDGKE